jgi:hypothetical protein
MLILVLRAVPIFCLCIAHTLAAGPHVILWSSQTYGPDGPWHAVTVKLGTPAQQMDLIPAGAWETQILSSSVCSTSTTLSGCNANAAGLFDPEKSSSLVTISETGTIKNGNFCVNGGGIPSMSGDAEWMFDTLSLTLQDGVVGNNGQNTIRNLSTMVISRGYNTLPSGSTYAAEVGKLSLGAPEINQSWVHAGSRFNATFLPGTLFEAGQIPSNSYGMHIGSVAAGVRPSLILGGYDPTRIIGPVSAQPYTILKLPIDLLDIGISVSSGKSPFKFTSKSGLLASNNASIGTSLPVVIDSASPYLYLPKSTCDAITSLLPLTYNPLLSLYIWDVTSPLYTTIISSPASLTFTFRLSSSITANMTISVPFALLNLTLTTPLVSSPIPYFPCRPAQVETLGENYGLGRAFLQAAFVGVNWGGDGLWFLAQAPGPNTPSLSPLTSIFPGDKTLKGADNGWEDSWKGYWKDGIDGDGNAIVPAGSTASGNGTGADIAPTLPDSALSRGVIAGIAVGAVGGVAVIAVLACLLYSRARRRQAERENVNLFAEAHLGNDGLAGVCDRYAGQGYGPTELYTQAPVGELHSDHNGVVGELHGEYKKASAVELP